MPQIHALPARVTQSEAIKMLSGGGLGSAIRRLRLGPLRSIACIYVPYHSFLVHIENAGKQDVRLIGIDAIQGTLDIFSFEHTDADAHAAILDLCRSADDRNVIPAELSEEHATAIVRSKVERILFQTGFFKMRNLSIRPESLHVQFHVPYWVGFFGDGEEAQIAVVDAVRRTVEGAKARALFESWLART